MFGTQSNRITQLHFNSIHIHTRACYMLYMCHNYELENLLDTEVFAILFPILVGKMTIYIDGFMVCIYIYICIYLRGYIHVHHSIYLHQNRSTWLHQCLLETAERVLSIWGFSVTFSQSVPNNTLGKCAVALPRDICGYPVLETLLSNYYTCELHALTCTCLQKA